MAKSLTQIGNAGTPTYLAEDFETWSGGMAWTWTPKFKDVEPSGKPVYRFNVRPGRVDLTKAQMTNPQFITTTTLPQSAGPKTSTSPSTWLTLSNGRSPLLRVVPYFEIKRSSKGGYGAFALEDIPARTVILSETALLKATNANILGNFETLSQEDKRQFMLLASFDKISPNGIISRFKTNRFQINGGNCGIFLIASRFNHACSPVCDYRFDMLVDKLILSTKAFVSKGQEITISYGQTGEGLTDGWGFICDCDQCNSSFGPFRDLNFCQRRE